MPRLLTVSCSLLLAGWASAADALESNQATSTRATASLISDIDTVAPGKPFHIGLRLRLAPGWHTYWQNPGDAGVPPALDLTLPDGARAGPIDWPAPQRIAEGATDDLRLYRRSAAAGYVTPTGPGGTLIKAHAEWLVCRDICVPEEADFQLNLPAGSQSRLRRRHCSRRPSGELPRPSPWQAVMASDGTLWVQGPELTPDTVVDAWFIPDGPAPSGMAPPSR